MASSGVFGNDYTADTLIVISTAVEKSHAPMPPAGYASPAFLLTGIYHLCHH